MTRDDGLGGVTRLALPCPPHPNLPYPTVPEPTQALSDLHALSTPCPRHVRDTSATRPPQARPIHHGNARLASCGLFSEVSRACPGSV